MREITIPADLFLKLVENVPAYTALDDMIRPFKALAALPKISIRGRRWWRKSAGHTLTACYVFVDGEMTKIGPTNGYGDHYLTMATPKLREVLGETLIPEGMYSVPTTLLRELQIDYDVLDVEQRRHLD